MKKERNCDKHSKYSRIAKRVEAITISRQNALQRIAADRIGARQCGAGS